MIMLEMSGKNPFYGRGLRFSCIRCSACCRYESGFVFLTENDVSTLTAALNMKYKEFTKAYCRWVPSANGNDQLSLREKTNKDCIFWKEGCTVYQARPLQCQSYPFWKYILESDLSWKQAALECPGINKGDLHSRESIEKWLTLRKKEPVIERVEKNEAVRG